jgi:hypothetical protein
MPKKTDNHRPESKLALRRHFLRAYHSDSPAHVLDCCQATGLLWKKLTKEFSLASYLPLDVKPRKGRLKLDSSRYLASPGWTHNVVDIDTYGSPWDHWLALLKTAPAQPLTVFLTIGMTTIAGGAMSNSSKLVLGLTFRATMPKSLTAQLHDRATLAMLAHARRCRFEIAECLEAPRGEHARYIGVRLVPMDSVPAGA